MDFVDADAYFDDDPVYDAYTGSLLFYAQVTSFDDHTGDGATNRRRVISTAPGTVLPARQVVSMYGDNWLVGRPTLDSFQGDVVRQHGTMKRVTDSMALLTPGQLLSGAAGTSVFVHKYYFKDDSNNLTDTEIDTFWNIFVAATEPAAKGSFFKDAGGRIYRVRNDYLPVEGLRVCQSDTLDVGALQTATWATGTYDPVSDTVSAGSAGSNVVAFDPSKFYRFRFISDEVNQRGDLAVFVSTSITPKQGDTFTMVGVKWRVLNVQPELDAWAVHARRV